MWPVATILGSNMVFVDGKISSGRANDRLMIGIIVNHNVDHCGSRARS